MPAPHAPDVIVYICTNCLPAGAHLPRQWSQSGAHVLVREMPCSGKMDGQYLLHAMEGGVRGLCVVACPEGECRLAEGNYRAEIRVRTLQRLLGEIGMEPDRAVLIHASPDDSPERFQRVVRDAVEQLCLLGASPLLAEPQQSTG
jgi:F420-non-reducing hydrogenase iron-sulfur subunit